MWRHDKWLKREAKCKGFFFLLIVLVALGAWGCGQEEEPTQEQRGAPIWGASDGDIWPRHILIQYAGAVGSQESHTRTRAEAHSFAESLRVRANAGEDFRFLAKKYSDDASAEAGGEIDILRRGETPAAFEEAAIALETGEISEVVESEYGFHVIQRRDMSRITAQHILFYFKGTSTCPDTLQRTRDEALELAENVLAKVRNPNGSFPVAASIYSDDEATAYRGGWLGGFLRGTMAKAFEEAAFGLEDYEISEIIETEFGFHIIRRVPDTTVRVSHILIVGADVQNQIETRSRPHEAALKLALDLAFRAKQGEDFADLAREYSDDSRTSKAGGRMPPVKHGVMVPAFEDAAYQLEVGQVSEVIKTKYGFHILKRTQ